MSCCEAKQDLWVDLAQIVLSCCVRRIITFLRQQTPSVLHPKLFIKTCHEHHVYMLMHVIECVDKFLIT